MVNARIDQGCDTVMHVNDAFLNAGSSARAVGNVPFVPPSAALFRRAVCFLSSQTSYEEFLEKLNASGAAARTLQSRLEDEGMNDIASIKKVNVEMLLRLSLRHEEIVCLVEGHDAWFQHIQSTFPADKNCTASFLEKSKQSLCLANICS